MSSLLELVLYFSKVYFKVSKMFPRSSLKVKKVLQYIVSSGTFIIVSLISKYVYSLYHFHQVLLQEFLCFLNFSCHCQISYRSLLFIVQICEHFVALPYYLHIKAVNSLQEAPFQMLEGVMNTLVSYVIDFVDGVLKKFMCLSIFVRHCWVLLKKILKNNFINKII